MHLQKELRAGLFVTGGRLGRERWSRIEVRKMTGRSEKLSAGLFVTGERLSGNAARGEA